MRMFDRRFTLEFLYEEKTASLEGLTITVAAVPSSLGRGDGSKQCLKQFVFNGVPGRYANTLNYEIVVLDS